MRSIAAFIALFQIIAICIVNLDGVQSFSSTSKTRVLVGNSATTSNLFRPIRQNIPSHRPFAFSPITRLKMTEEKDDGASTEIDQKPSSDEESAVGKEKERSGFWTALVLAPPLLAKFGIVLLVKVITDLIVFPLLFLFRISKIVKNKFLGLFGKDDIYNGNKVNGN